MVLGENVSTSMEFFRLVPIEAFHGFVPNLVFVDDIVACDKNVAPEYDWQDKDGMSLYILSIIFMSNKVCVAAVYRVCPLRSDLTSIPHSKFQRTTNSMGEQFYKISYHLRLTLVGEVLRFELLFDGKVCGQVSEQYKD